MQSSFLPKFLALLIFSVIIFFVVLALKNDNSNDDENTITSFPPTSSDDAPLSYDSLMKRDSIKLIPKDTSAYKGNWVDINN